MRNTLKKRLALLLAVVMLLGVLSGCTEIAEYLDTPEAPQRLDWSGEDYIDMVPFSEMEYVRPDMDKELQRIDDLIAALSERTDSFADNRRTERDLNNIYGAYFTFATMRTLARIRYDLDTSDSYYEEETAYCADAGVELGEKMEELFYACAASEQQSVMDDFFGEGYLDSYKGQDYTYPEDYVALLRRETALEQQYAAALAAAHTTYDGKDYTLSELMDAAYAEELGELTPDDALKLYYDDVNPQIGQIYVDLVKVRMELADYLGYDNYMEYGYQQHGRDYTAEDAEDYTAAIREYLVPLYKRAKEEGLTASANDTMMMKPRKCLQAVTDAVYSMGGVRSEAMDFMLAYGLVDVEQSNTKYAGSYETYLEDYESPFVLVNSIGYSEDTITIAHEFGHFLADYMNYGISVSTDVDEALSQGMEYLTLCYIEDEGLAEELTAYKLTDTLRLYAEQGSYNAFEERVYALSPEEVTLERVNQIALETSEEYGVTGRWSDDYYAKSWIEITHFFEMPFYIISYCVSDTAAFQLYEMELETPGLGLDMHEDYIDLAAEEEFMDIADDCGLTDPLSAEAVKDMADTLEEMLF